MESPRSNRGRVMFLGVLSVLFLAVGGSCYNSDLFQAYRGYDEQARLAKQEGVLLEFSQYKAPAVSDAENPAPVYRKAIQDLQGTYKDSFTILKGFTKVEPPSGNNAEFDDALDKVQPLLDEVSEASKLPTLDFGRDWSQGFSIHFSEYAPLRMVSDAMRLDGRRRLQREDVDGALDRAAAIARVGNHIGQEPTVIAALIRAGSVDQAFNILAPAIADHGCEAKVREGVRRVISDMGPPPDLRFATQMESAFQVEAMDSLGQGADWISAASGSAVPPAAKLGRLSFVRQAYKTRVIEYWRGFYSCLPSDPTDYMGAFHAVRKHDEQYDSAHDHSGHDHARKVGLSYQMLDYVRPTFAGASSAMARHEAKKRLLLAALEAIEGKPITQIDPFSRKPIVHKGNIVYSFAENEKDDGGSTKRDQGMSLPLDFVLRLPN